MVYQFLYKNQQSCWFRASGQSVYVLAEFIQNEYLDTKYICGNNLTKTIDVELCNINELSFHPYEEDSNFYLFLKPTIGRKLYIDYAKEIYQYIPTYHRKNISDTILPETWKKIFSRYDNNQPIYPDDKDEYDDYLHFDDEEELGYEIVDQEHNNDLDEELLDIEEVKMTYVNDNISDTTENKLEKIAQDFRRSYANSSVHYADGILHIPIPINLQRKC
jgi:hypothetical protein